MLSRLGCMVSSIWAHVVPKTTSSLIFSLLKNVKKPWLYTSRRLVIPRAIFHVPDLTLLPYHEEEYTTKYQDELKNLSNHLDGLTKLINSNIENMILLVTSFKDSFNKEVLSSGSSTAEACVKN